MAKAIVTAQFVSVNSNSLHSLGVVSSCELEVEGADVDVTNMASGGWEENLTGLFKGSISIAFFQDFAASQLDSIIWPLFIARSPVPFEIRQTTSAVGTSNPKWTGNLRISKWGFKGKVGDAGTIDVQWPLTGALTRATS